MNILHNEKLVFETDPTGITDIETYVKRGGFSALKKVLASSPEEGIAILEKAGLRGRGGAAFPTSKKISMVRESVNNEKYIICNADEGEPGTFKDRFVMTRSPFQLLEGIAIAAYLAGANKGYIYVRHEYPEAQSTLLASIIAAASSGFLGKSILGTDFSLELELFSGAGSYLCGEETALLSSIEGKKGRPRLKPPYPTQAGLWDKPTLINNVETLSIIPIIFEKGAEWYRSIGTADSHGTKLISLSGDVVRRGLCEVPFGITFREIIERFGGGMPKGRSIKAVNIGGASGVLVPQEMLDVPLEYGACAKAGITIGSGAIFVLDDTRSILENVRNRVRFFLHESCGKCTPCREGLRQATAIINKLLDGNAYVADVNALERYTRAIQNASFCGLGQAAGNSLQSSLSYYREEYLSYCIDKELELAEKESA